MVGSRKCVTSTDCCSAVCLFLPIVNVVVLFVFFNYDHTHSVTKQFCQISKCWYVALKGNDKPHILIFSLKDLLRVSAHVLYLIYPFEKTTKPSVKPQYALCCCAVRPCLKAKVLIHFPNLDTLNYTNGDNGFHFWIAFKRMTVRKGVSDTVRQSDKHFTSLHQGPLLCCLRNNTITYSSYVPLNLCTFTKTACGEPVVLMLQSPL